MSPALAGTSSAASAALGNPWFWISVAVVGGLIVGWLWWGVWLSTTARYRHLPDDVRTALLNGASVTHYVREQYLEVEVDVVTLRPRRGWYAAPARFRGRVEALYFYVGSNGRGGRYNHGSNGQRYPHARVTIEGARFLAWAGDATIHYRPWDHALAVVTSVPYVGPAVVTHGVRTVDDRRATASRSRD